MKIERQFAEVRASNEDRKVKFIFSTDSKDRHGTRINPDGWRLDNFNKNGIASFQHRAYGDPDPDMIIGRAQAWKSDGRLVGTIDFEDEEVNPLAEKLYKKVKAGTLNAVSVGFVEHDGHWGQDKERGTPDEEKDTYYFDDVELMEISLVTVPSNPEALAYRTFEATGVQKWVQSQTAVPEFQTDLTDEVINTNTMEKEEKKDLAPETSKVEVELKTEGFEKAVEKLADVVERMKAPENIPGAPAPEISEKDERDLAKYSIARAIWKKAQAQGGTTRFDGIELEMHQEAVKENKERGITVQGLGVPGLITNPKTRADLKATVDASGGYTVATDLPGFIDTLKNSMASMKAGAMLWTGLEGDVSIPKASANSTATWRSEGGVSTQSDPTFTAVTMSPNRLTTHTEYTMQLLKQSTIDIERFVRENLYYSIANALETAIYEGSGSSNQPTGILEASVNDATHGSTNPTAATWANIVGMESMVAVDNALNAACAYIMKSTAAASLKTTEKASNTAQFIWQDAPLTGGTVNGYPAFVTNVFTDDTVIFGNFKELIVGQWGQGLDLLVNPYSLDTYATIRVVVAGYYDVALRHAESFARIDDLAV